MTQKGFIPVIIIIGIAVVGGASLLMYKAATGNPPAFLSNIISKLVSSEESAESTPTTILNTVPTVYSSATPIITFTQSTTTPTSKPKTSTPKPTAIQTTTPSIKYNTCQISVLADSSSQYNVWLAAGATSQNGSYIKGAQWDFDGNGSWDTDMSITNQNITRNYPQSDTYTVKLKTVMSDGSTTDVCSHQVTIPMGFTVSLKGSVYEDRNCNDMREPDEKGLAGVSVSITNVDGYSNLATLTTDLGGSYNFSYVLSGNNAITVQPHDKPLENYGVTLTRHQITLSSNQREINMDLGQIPSPVGNYCGF